MCEKRQMILLCFVTLGIKLGIVSMVRLLYLFSWLNCTESQSHVIQSSSPVHPPTWFKPIADHQYLGNPTARLTGHGASLDWNIWQNHDARDSARYFGLDESLAHASRPSPKYLAELRGPKATTRKRLWRVRAPRTSPGHACCSTTRCS